MMKLPRYTFALMFSIFFLLNVNYAILRSLRNTLAVADLGGGAHSIPVYELVGVLPGAIFMTWSLGRLMNQFSFEKVFLITLTSFIAFFLSFNLFIYPLLLAIKGGGLAADYIIQFFLMMFYVMAELWKPALAVILFWGLINRCMPVSEAKGLYAPLMLGGSLGLIAAGPLVSLCTSESIGRMFNLSTSQWRGSLNLMVIFITLIGMVTAYLYHKLWERLDGKSTDRTMDSEGLSSEKYSLKESIQLCMKNRPLRLLSWIVFADYISYSLGEVIFLEVLKIHYPQPADYCHFLGNLSMWTGVLTFFSSICLAPYILRNYHLTVAYLITPLCLLVTEGAFFVFLRGYLLRDTLFALSETEWVGLVVMLGSVQYCVCRAAKNTLFDSSKELTFVLMPEAERMRGKLVIDGLCSRVGRGCSSVLSIGLIGIFGGVIASSFVSGLIAIGMAVSWLRSSLKLGKAASPKEIIS